MAKKISSNVNASAFLSPSVKKIFAQVLLSWFDQKKRNLPWRNTKNPYAIWISEVMLQQTQVATVIPYFERFLVRFPDVLSLAVADEQEVLKLWQGLGYYRRARHLHQAAKLIASNFNGIFPTSLDNLASLPGLGRYTINAVLSQAFDYKLPILEANTKRVLARLFASKLDVDSSLGNKFLWDAAEEILPEKDVGAFNQGMMELGSLVCVPVNPHCQVCPLETFCKAKRMGLVSELPIRKKKLVITEVDEFAVILENKGKLLLGKRPIKQRWAGLWEVPHDVSNPDKTEIENLEAIAYKYTSLKPKSFFPLGLITHPVTRYRIKVRFFLAKVSGIPRSDFYEELAWVPLSEVEQYPKSSPQTKIIAMALEFLSNKPAVANPIKKRNIIEKI